MPPQKLSRRSATSKRRREAYAAKGALDKRPVLFIDRAVQGRLLIEALREEGANIQLHQDHFSDNSPDTTWLPEIGKRDWCVLTRDKAIQHNPLEKRAIQNARVGFFVLSSPEVTGEELAQIIVKALPVIERIALTANKPFIARIVRSGAVKLVSQAKPEENQEKAAQ